MISTKRSRIFRSFVTWFSKLKWQHWNLWCKTRKELLELIAMADVGLSALPDIELFNSSTPMKVLDYYQVPPCIMSNNENNTSIFEDNVSAWFTTFDKESIQKKLEYIISF